MKIILGITGASGALYGVHALDILQRYGAQVYLVITSAGQITLKQEMNLSWKELSTKADKVYRINDIGADIASGSFKTDGMLIAPCSVRALSDIANGSTHCLLTRAADVILKERRKLVLMFRETPLHIGHVRNILAVTEMGAIVAPPVPAWYCKPSSLEEMARQNVLRCLNLFGIETEENFHWQGIQAC